ncbi:alpha-amylase family protein [Blautia ammoniilytica]|uniref:Alpha-amylase family protein n=1 Tax=Blautia ammoniilytica TaxID=2981782 RepID=A0ABT2TVR4_9FIRM|nr:alpha-amylase family protein [Blautia ammoniilytica]MCU6766300.1 alpha-amylase family protein [Blautia ammoniilytica]SCI52082.1 Amylosucrase [uncultured Blautia sp.]
MSDSMKWKPEFRNRYECREAELRSLYEQLYPGQKEGFAYLIQRMYQNYVERPVPLRKIDRKREKDPGWYKGNDILGMMMYTDAFAGTLQGVKEKLDYVKSCGVNYLHMMPLLESPKGRDDGGYAVADFRKVKPELGTIEDLKELTFLCHEQGISCCLDFVMNHTSEDHAWAKAARAGDPQARSRYFFYDNWDIPNRYEETTPQVFPTTAPGNFTWLPDCNQVVMTTFYPYQWDLNYANCMVFNDMVDNMLFLTNCGIDVIRLDAVPYIWKELGTKSRNLPQVHTLVRMMRLVSEIVCPGVLLLGEVVMEPAKVLPYFGSVDKPECHMLYNVTTMASTWNTIATKDVSLLRRQMDQVCALPKEYVFLNYLRCHDDIGWGLDYDWLKQFGIEEVPHKKYLNDVLTGRGYDSDARGELYNDDPRLGDARLCGTTASLCGLETALYENNPDKVKRAVACDLMLHAYLLIQSGIPVLYSGDEVGQLNDYSYKENPDKCADSRYLHRGKFQWEKLKKTDKNYRVSMEIFHTLRKMEEIREQHPVFNGKADVWTFDTGYSHVLGIGRYLDGEEIRAYFNFSEYELDEVWMPMDEGRKYTDLLSGMTMEAAGNHLSGYGCRWFYRKYNH